MECKATYLSYGQTNQFSSLVVDYISQNEFLTPFYQFPASTDGILEAVKSRKQYPTDRSLLVNTFRRIYKDIPLHPSQEVHLRNLEKENTFTICTAHQPNLFTGYLYFIYKVVHAIKLAAHLNELYPSYHFVPVFFMGAEDNDLEELNRARVDGVSHVWNTGQQGAVGRMKVDSALLNLINEIEGQVGVLPFGGEVIQMLRESYVEGSTVAEATLKFINYLFASEGLLVLLPDDPMLKTRMLPVFQDDLLEHKPHELVSEISARLESAYRIQMNPREINLFYLKEDIRERITGNSSHFSVPQAGLSFNRSEIIDELNTFPERFSPNVVLRGLYQETILPNIVFIGGGSEVAYWLELKSLFHHYKVPFPVLVLRNSFLLVTEEQERIIRELGFEIPDLFETEHELMTRLVHRVSPNQLSLSEEKSKLEALYAGLKEKAEEIDKSLLQHIGALENEAMKGLDNLEKKLLRAEKKKYEVYQRQLQKVRSELFPEESLQERKENIIPFYARYGREILHQIYEYSPTLSQEFTILTGF